MVSSAGSLKFQKIIHAVGPRWRGGRNHEEITLLNCVNNVFEEAKNQRLQSIAIPPLSTGIFGYPLPEAVATIVDALATRESTEGDLPLHVTFFDIKNDSLKLYEKELRKRYTPAKIPTPSKSPSTQRLSTPQLASISGKLWPVVLYHIPKNLLA